MRQKISTGLILGVLVVGICIATVVRLQPLNMHVPGIPEIQQVPKPVLTSRAIEHIMTRHYRTDLYPGKSKFLPSVNPETLLMQVFTGAQVITKKSSRYIYDYDGGSVVGIHGETVVRLVTAGDGTVITMYPRKGRLVQHAA